MLAKYNHPDGKVVLSVYVADPERVRLEVNDTGLGMQPTTYLSLFSPFERLGDSPDTREQVSALRCHIVSSR